MGLISDRKNIYGKYVSKYKVKSRYLYSESAGSIYNNIMRRDNNLKLHNNNISTGASTELKDDKITFFY